MKILHLTVHFNWFELIAKGIKKEEYRELKSYWIKRLVKSVEPYSCKNCLNSVGYKTVFKPYTHAIIKNGYQKNAPTLLVELANIRLGKPKSEWCSTEIEFDSENGSFDDCFVIELGKVLEVKNYQAIEVMNTHIEQAITN